MTTSSAAQPLGWRMLLCHKHPVSARLRFLIPCDGGVVLPQPLPQLAVICENGESPQVQSHPASALRHLQEYLGLDSELELVPDFQLCMEIPGEPLPVYLAALPGHNLCDAPEGMRWIELPQAIGMPWLDRELLRRVYEVLLG